MLRRNALDLSSAGVLMCSLLAIQAPAREAMAQEGPFGGNSQEQAVASGVTVWDTGRSSREVYWFSVTLSSGEFELAILEAD